MNLAVENLGRRATELAREQRQPSFRVNRRFVFGKDDQGRTRLIQTRIHSGSDFHATGESQANVNTVLHLVSGERALDFLDDFFARPNFGERKRGSRLVQTIEMLVQFENATAVNAQSFPNGVATLHRRIERTDSRFVAMNQLTVNVNDQIAVSFVEFLKHFLSSSFQAYRTEVDEIPP